MPPLKLPRILTKEADELLRGTNKKAVKTARHGRVKVWRLITIRSISFIPTKK